jgi:hypothetical protein
MFKRYKSGTKNEFPKTMAQRYKICRSFGAFSQKFFGSMTFCVDNSFHQLAEQ